jgi:hypothetical protein
MSQPKARRLVGRVALVLGAAALCSCGVFEGGAGSRPEGFRLVSGTLELPPDGIVGRQVTGLQLVAVGVTPVSSEDGTLSTEPVVFTSQPFDASTRREENAFVVAVDGTVGFNLVLQVPSGSGTGPGEYQGVLRFDNGRGEQTTLIPRGETDLDLGVVSAADPVAETRVDNELTVAAGNNPLASSHSDDDGVSDLLDDDDDDDGLTDGTDSDVDGDGLGDALQLLEGFADEDADGIPDLFR